MVNVQKKKKQNFSINDSFISWLQMLMTIHFRFCWWRSLTKLQNIHTHLTLEQNIIRKSKIKKLSCPSSPLPITMCINLYGNFESCIQSFFIYLLTLMIVCMSIFSFSLSSPLFSFFSLYWWHTMSMHSLLFSLKQHRKYSCFKQLMKNPFNSGIFIH